ncbi:MAG TPA: adenosine kinase [Acidimicrobiales bacterium]|nr:adenosine kinase [Acidimicrobiales bacterium]
MSPPYDVVAVGHAIVDVVVAVEAEELAATGLTPGTMTLIGEEEAERLYAAGAAGREVAGGSAANTAVGVASLGGSAAFVGRVGDDRLGKVFVDDLAAVGVDFDTPPAADVDGTGRCIVFVTPDGERTMRTYLGAGPHIGEDCVDEALIGGARLVYLEGYLWDAASAAAAVGRAISLSRRSGAQLALSLSDPGCVERHREELSELLTAGAVDVLFANEAEIVELLGADGFDSAVEEVGRLCPVAALTRGELGSVVVTAAGTTAVPAHPPRRVVDTTGAGDLYAAGFLYGMCRHLPPEACARLGGLAAAEVISVLGGRPHARLADLAAKSGLV